MEKIILMVSIGAIIVIETLFLALSRNLTPKVRAFRDGRLIGYAFLWPYFLLWWVIEKYHQPLFIYYDLPPYGWWLGLPYEIQMFSLSLMPLAVILAGLMSIVMYFIICWDYRDLPDYEIDLLIRADFLRTYSFLAIAVLLAELIMVEFVVLRPSYKIEFTLTGILILLLAAYLVRSTVHPPFWLLAIRYRRMAKAAPTSVLPASSLMEEYSTEFDPPRNHLMRVRSVIDLRKEYRRDHILVVCDGLAEYQGVTIFLWVNNPEGLVGFSLDSGCDLVISNPRLVELNNEGILEVLVNSKTKIDKMTTLSPGPS